MKKLRTPNPSKVDQMELVKTIGSQLKKARELCHYSQTTAAKKLGYLNSSKLAKIERASDTHSVPLWLILRASSVYEVSVDFLFGLTKDDWEYDAVKTQERIVSPWLWTFYQKAYSREMAALSSLNKKISMVAGAVNSNSESLEHVVKAFERFKQANPRFEDEARCGALLERSIQEALKTANESKSQLERFKNECLRAHEDYTPQMNLPLFEGEK